MPTYTVSIIISDLNSIKRISSKYNVEVEIIGSLDAIKRNQTQKILEKAANIVDFISDFIGVPFPFHKTSKN